MREIGHTTLAELTTLRLGGPAKHAVEVQTEDELVAVVEQCDQRGEPVLVVGGGSNLVVADDGFDGTVVRVATRGVDVDLSGSCESGDLASCGGVLLRVAAGEPWDDLVARCVADEWSGIEALSGIPGLAGAAPMQNVGAYGQEIAQTLWQVRTYDRVDGRFRTFANADCRFAYRNGRFKGTDRYLILAVTFQLREGNLSAPVRYAELAGELGVELGARVPSEQVRAAVLELRRRKGMVLDPHDHDTWSAGSFFTNPVVSAEQAALLPADAPRWPVADGVKTSAAWLIEHAGVTRGYAGHADGVAVSAKHALALTNRGQGTTSELLTLARDVRDRVLDRFGIALVPEPALIGCAL